MAAQLKKPSIQLAVMVVGMLLLAGFAFGISDADANQNLERQTGRLDVDGVVYRFAPTTCTITDTDFLAAGKGRIDGEPFWVSASANGMDLTVGPESEAERPADDDLWLISVDEVRWESTTGSVTASAVMRDERDTNARSFRGALSVSCAAT